MTTENTTEHKELTHQDIQNTIADLNNNTLNPTKVADALTFLLNQVEELKKEIGLKEQATQKITETETDLTETLSKPTHVPLLKIEERLKWEQGLAVSSIDYVCKTIISEENPHVKAIARNRLLQKTGTFGSIALAPFAKYFTYRGKNSIDIPFFIDTEKTDACVLHIIKEGTKEELVLSKKTLKDLVPLFQFIDRALGACQSLTPVDQQHPFKDRFDSNNRDEVFSSWHSLRFKEQKPKKKRQLRDTQNHDFYCTVEFPEVKVLVDYLNNRWKSLQKKNDKELT